MTQKGPATIAYGAQKTGLAYTSGLGELERQLRMLAPETERWRGDVSPALRNTLLESRSSGGLLVALPEYLVADSKSRAQDSGIIAALVGSAIAEPAGRFEVRD